MPQTRLEAPRSLNSDSGSSKRATQATLPKNKTMQSRPSSSGIIKTNGSGSCRVKVTRVESELEGDEEELHYDNFTIDEIKKELRELEVPIPSRRNKPFLYELLEEKRNQRLEGTQYETKKMAEPKKKTRRLSEIRAMEKEWTELKELIAKHGVSLDPKLIEALKQEYKVPAEIKDERNIPVQVDEASQPDRARGGRTNQSKAIKALPRHTTSARSGSIRSQQASTLQKHQMVDDGNGPLSTHCETLVDSTRNTRYDTMLECIQPGDNVNKFFGIQVSNYMFVRFHSASLCFALLSPSIQMVSS
jgi:hypothetical protein